MIGVDTNLLVRFLVKDDADQFELAKRVLNQSCSVSNPGWIGVIVLCEFVWVLLRSYRYPHENVAAILAQLLRTAEFQIEDEALVRVALDRFTSGKQDFADALIGLRNQRSGASPTLTFDRFAAAMPEFRLVDS